MGLLRVEVVVTTMRIGSCRLVLAAVMVAEEKNRSLLLRHRGRATSRNLVVADMDMMLLLLRDKDYQVGLPLVGEVLDYQVVLEDLDFRLL
jgi:hypothetical protein